MWDVGARKEAHVFSTDGNLSVSLTFSTDAKALMTVRGKRKAAIFTRSGTKFRGILAASVDIPKANVCAGGDNRLSIAQQRR